MHCLDLNTLEFKEIEQKGIIPLSRRRQMMILIGSSIILIGGFNGNYLNDMHHMNLFHLKTKRYEILREKPEIEEKGDIKILCDGVDFWCFKKKLVAKSDYFKAFFSKPFCEENAEIIEIQTVSAKIMALILEFIACGDIKDQNLTEIEEIQIVKASKFFIMEDLILLMQEKLIKSLIERENWKNHDKILGFYEICVKWNLDYLLKFIFVLIGLRKETENSTFIEEFYRISMDSLSFDENMRKIERIRNDLKFLVKFTENGNYFKDVF